jgi:hypothetical protein
LIGQKEDLSILFFISGSQGDLDPWYYGLKPFWSESSKPLDNIGIITETFLPETLFYEY